jgi:hypothetical protein
LDHHRSFWYHFHTNFIHVCISGQNYLSFSIPVQFFSVFLTINR